MPRHRVVEGRRFMRRVTLNSCQGALAPELSRNAPHAAAHPTPARATARYRESLGWVKSRSESHIPDAEIPDASPVPHTAASASNRPRWIPQSQPAPVPDKTPDVQKAEPRCHPAAQPCNDDAWFESRARWRVADRSEKRHLRFPIE